MNMATHNNLLKSECSKELWTTWLLNYNTNFGSM